MHLTAVEEALLNGERSQVLAHVFEEQVRVGEFFDASSFVPVTNAHFMGDFEVFGETGYEYLARLVEAGLRAVVPTTRNAQCVDFVHSALLGQPPDVIGREMQVRGLLRELGILLVDTCIGYQTVYQPAAGEHVAWGDTGTVIYANSVLGARTNFEAGSASLAAALTGRTPAYGFHLDKHRYGTVHTRVEAEMADVADWGALGAIVGERYRGYWNVPVFEFPRASPQTDDLKHLGAALASYGSMGMFHIVGVTPEAPTLGAATGGKPPSETCRVDEGDLSAFFDRDSWEGDVDLVVFSGPQLSLMELRKIASGLEGKRLADHTDLLVTTNRMNFVEAESQGYVEVITAAGGTVVQGTCWYLMDPVSQQERFGWRRVVTNSAKIANIVRAHGYAPVVRRTAECLEAAVTGKLAA